MNNKTAWKKSKSQHTAGCTEEGLTGAHYRNKTWRVSSPKMGQLIRPPIIIWRATWRGRDVDVAQDLLIGSSGSPELNGRHLQGRRWLLVSLVKCCSTSHIIVVNVIFIWGRLKLQLNFHLLLSNQHWRLAATYTFPSYELGQICTR